MADFIERRIREASELGLPLYTRPPAFENYTQRKFREMTERGYRDLFIAVPFFGSIVLILYLLYVIILVPYMIITIKPTCSIEEFYVPALDKTVNTTIPSNIIFFDIKLQNYNMAKGVKYAPINLTFYYGLNTSFPVGNYVIPEFYQGINKFTNRREVAETHGVPWLAARGLVSNGSTASFRVGLTTLVRFRWLGIFFKKHKMIVGAKVEVADSGEKVGKNGIKFRSNGLSVIGRLRG